MKIYHYHPETGVFIGEGIADPSPLEPGAWLVPAHATEVAPPEVGEGMEAALIEGAWEVRPIPEPEPEAIPEPETTPVEPEPLTPLQKLERLGLTPDDLRAILSSAEA